MTRTPVDPTGQQIRLTRGDVTAHISQVGAALRGLAVGGTAIVPPYPEGAMAPSGSGVVLVPWPNRVRDGRWRAVDPHGRAYDEQLAIDEVPRRNAIHGLLRWTAYEVDEGDGSVTLSARILPRRGYPFALDTRVTYALADDGIRVTHEIENIGADAAPVGVGTHPFLFIEGVATEDLVLAVSAETFFEVDDRLLPVAESPVSGSVDLRGGVRVGDAQLDTAFGGLRRDADGRARATLTAPDGRVLALWQDEAFDFLQVFTTSSYPGQSRAVAVEPMTMPADALNSGQGLRWVEPGETWSASWGVALSR